MRRTANYRVIRLSSFFFSIVSIVISCQCLKCHKSLWSWKKVNKKLKTIVIGRTEVLFHLLGRTNISYSRQQILLSWDNKYPPLDTTNILVFSWQLTNVLNSSKKILSIYSHSHFLDTFRFSEQEGSGKGVWNYFFY